MLDFVIHEFIARRRRIEELARGRSNMEGEVLHTKHRKRAPPPQKEQIAVVTGTAVDYSVYA